MTTKEIIESGNLELYVFGLLNEHETKKISELAKFDTSIHDEIISIEKAIISLSSSFSPNISADNFEKIRAKLNLKHEGITEKKPKNNFIQYLGWAASIILSLCVSYQYLIIINKGETLKTASQKK
jgi:hypothetical protein